MENEKNPYANPDGSPIDGKEPEFFAWEKMQGQKRLNEMSPEEREKAIKSQEALQKRMES